MFAWLLSSIYFLYLVVIIGVALVVIMENRNPVKTIAWVIVLLTLPVVGFLVYLLFGQDKRRRKLISKRRFNKIKNSWRSVAISPRQRLPEGVGNAAVASLISQVAQAELFSGNSIKVFTDGNDKFASLIEHIRGAKHHIHLQYYIFEEDEIGTFIQKLLIEKATEGVEVRVIYDDLGCWKVDDSFYIEMKQNGVEVCDFLPVTFKWLTGRVNYRNHRKVVVIDGRIGYVGGMNIADRYLKGNRLGIWRDTHVLIEGGGVHGLQQSFAIDWYFAKKKLLQSSSYFPALEEKGNVYLQIISGGPFSEWRELSQAFFKVIVSAQRYLYIQTPYLMPSENLITALQSAAMGGVDVRITIPERSDTFITNIGNRSFLAELLKAGVKIYFYREGFIHSKLMVADDGVSTVGSTNMDVRSFEFNFEISAFLYDNQTAVQMRKIYLKDLEKCTRVTYQQWKLRPKKQRLVESVVRLLSPLL